MQEYAQAGYDKSAEAASAAKTKADQAYQASADAAGNAQQYTSERAQVCGCCGCALDSDMALQWGHLWKPVQRCHRSSHAHGSDTCQPCAWLASKLQHFGPAATCWLPSTLSVGPCSETK